MTGALSTMPSYHALVSGVPHANLLSLQHHGGQAIHGIFVESATC